MERLGKSHSSLLPIIAFNMTNISSLPMKIPRAVIKRPQLDVFGPITEAESPVVAKAEANSK